MICYLLFIIFYLLFVIYYFRASAGQILCRFQKLSHKLTSCFVLEGSDSIVLNCSDSIILEGAGSIVLEGSDSIVSGFVYLPVLRGV